MTSMTQFFRRFIGALVLDAGAFEDIEADRHASLQSAVVVMAVGAAGGVAAASLGIGGAASFVSGAAMALGGWLVWVAMIAAIGTLTLPEPQTRSDVRELLRVLGYAAAPGIFIALAAMRSAAPIVITIVAFWMMASAVVGLRQALDYRSTVRAVAVCVLGCLLSFGVMAVVAAFFTRTVS
jgi:4-hydroxybenzoate polyprenyltransferase